MKKILIILLIPSFVFSEMITVYDYTTGKYNTYSINNTGDIYNVYDYNKGSYSYYNVYTPPVIIIPKVEVPTVAPTKAETYKGIDYTPIFQGATQINQNRRNDYEYHQQQNANAMAPLMVPAIDAGADCCSDWFTGIDMDWGKMSDTTKIVLFVAVFVSLASQGTPGQ